MWKVSTRVYGHSKNVMQHGKYIVRKGSTGQSRGSSRVLSVGGAAVLTVIGGSVALANFSEGFRVFTEDNIPGSSAFFNFVLGPTPPKLDDLPKPVGGLLQKKLERDAAKKKDDLLIINTEAAPQFVSPKPSETSHSDIPIKDEKEQPQEEILAPPVQDSNEGSESEETTEKDFPALLAELQEKATNAVNEAVAAQDKAAKAIKSHVELVYKALEMTFEPGQIPENTWEPVAAATQEKIEAVETAEATAQKARLAVAELKEAIANGIKSNQTIQSPDVITLDEAVARALYSLETAKARVADAQSEAKVMDEYRELVDTARRHLQMELSAIRPELTPAFSNLDAKLGEEELNMLMAHAYWKIITLQKELAKQQSMEQQRLRTALETQRKEDGVALETRLRAELERQYYELKAQFGHEMSLHEKSLSSQFTQQLKRQAAAHSDHLNEMLETQYQEIKRKYDSQLELELAGQQLSLQEQCARLLGLAKGIQIAVHRRAENDRVSRQVRELWVATQGLIDSLNSNSTAHLSWEDQRRPINKSLALLNDIKHNDEFLNAVVAAVPKEAKENGVLPQGAIKERFLNVERVCRRVALIGDDGGSLIRYALSYLQSILVIKPDISQIAHEAQKSEVNPEKLNTFDILARARFHLEKDDLEQALRYMNLLRGEPRNVARDWLQDLRCHLETIQAARAILTYAAAVAIESM